MPAWVDRAEFRVGTGRDRRALSDRSEPGHKEGEMDRHVIWLAGAGLPPPRWETGPGTEKPACRTPRTEESQSRSAILLLQQLTGLLEPGHKLGSDITFLENPERQILLGKEQLGQRQKVNQNLINRSYNGGFTFGGMIALTRSREKSHQGFWGTGRGC